MEPTRSLLSKLYVGLNVTVNADAGVVPRAGSLTVCGKGRDGGMLTVKTIVALKSVANSSARLAKGS
jgi:hypothetical protein